MHAFSGNDMNRYAEVYSPGAGLDILDFCEREFAIMDGERESVDQDLGSCPLRCFILPECSPKLSATSQLKGQVGENANGSIG